MRTEEFGQSGTLSYVHDKVADPTYVNNPKIRWKGVPYMDTKSNTLGLNGGKSCNYDVNKEQKDYLN